MTCEETKPFLADYWAGILRDADEMALEAHFADCAACREESARLQTLWNGLAAMPSDDPDPNLRGRFYESLGAYRQGAESRGRKFEWWHAAAAAVLLGVGLSAGYALRSDSTGKQVAQLRQEVSGMRQLVALSLLQQQSASERLRGISYALRAEPSDTETLSALVTALRQDSNVNVRLAAVDALHTFAGSPVSRQAVRDALPKETTPLVQVALIDLLVEWKEQRAAAELTRLAADASVNVGVKQRAQWALENLQ